MALTGFRSPLLISALALGCAGFGGAVKAQEDRELPGWELTFSDEFDGEGLDRKKWNVTDPWEAERNAELQAYVPGSIEIRNGLLRLRAERRKAFYDNRVREFTSGIVTTARKFSQKQGRFAIRCRIPKGQGLWPAFWMLPDPPSWPPEIDILEILGHEPHKVYMTNHWPHPDNPTGASKSNGGEWKGVDFSADFHTFAVEWDPGEIRWYVDGVERHRSADQVPDVPMFLLINLAVGGQWPGNPDESTPFPAWFEVDWVRVWKRK
ncbi:MAG: glycoside hydrolase family 16 protein [Verrucomicrobiae bacterium]|nr:glycoside hydrolase family 16 protein [Verrucomicrobiae bacterium]